MDKQSTQSIQAEFAKHADIGTIVGRANARETKRDAQFENLVNGHLDPKREKARAEGKQPGEKAGDAAPDTADASSAGDGLKDLLLAGPPEPGVAPPTGGAIVTDRPIVAAPRTGIDANGSAESLTAEGAKTDLQLNRIAGGGGRADADRATAPNGKTTAAETLSPAARSISRPVARPAAAPVAGNGEAQSPTPPRDGGESARQNSIPGQVKIAGDGGDLVSRPRAALAPQAALAQSQAAPRQANVPAVGPTPAEKPASPSGANAGTDGFADGDADGAGQSNRRDGQPIAPPPTNAGFRQTAQARANGQAAAGRGGDGGAPQPSQAANNAGNTNAPQTAGPQGAGQQSERAQNPRQAANTHNPQQARQALHNQALADQVAVQIHKAVRNGIDRITVQLKPAQLGRIEIQMEVGHDGRVNAVVAADRAETLDLLMKDARMLERALQDAGLRTDSDSLSFRLRDDRAGDDDRGKPKQGGPEGMGEDFDPSDDAFAMTDAAGMLLFEDGGVDISV